MDTIKIRQIIDNVILASVPSISEIKAFVLVGSLAYGNFLDGWSDIDLVCIIDKPSFMTYMKVKEMSEEISRRSKLKCGVDFVSYDQLWMAMKNPEVASCNLKFIKNFNKLNKNLNNSIIYLRKEYKIPIFTKPYLLSTSYIPYLLGIQSYFDKYLTDTNNYSDQKKLLRKIVKNSLFIIQTIYLKKQHKLIYDFGTLLNKVTEEGNLIETDIQALIDTYNLRTSWPSLNDKTLDSNLINQNWMILLNLLNIALNKC